jgi:integrase/recombinase XerD
MLRHSAATGWIRAGVPIEIVAELLTHANVATTSGTYVHLDVEDLRAELHRAGVR